jgi:hypothetical protein
MSDGVVCVLGVEPSRFKTQPRQEPPSWKFRCDAATTPLERQRKSTEQSLHDSRLGGVEMLVPCTCLTLMLLTAPVMRWSLRFSRRLHAASRDRLRLSRSPFIKSLNTGHLSIKMRCHTLDDSFSASEKRRSASRFSAAMPPRCRSLELSEPEYHHVTRSCILAGPPPHTCTWHGLR